MGYRLFHLRIIYSLLIIITTSVLGSEWVKYGWQLYDQAGDAHLVSLGGSQVGDGRRITSILLNPAHTTFDMKDQVGYSHQSRYGNLIQNDLLSFSLRKGFGRPVNIVLLQQHIGGIPNTENGLLDWGEDGIPGTQDLGEGNGILDEGERLDPTRISNFKQQQWGLYISTTWMLHDWTMGAAIKGMFHSLDKHFANGIGVNLGAKKQLWWQLYFGVAISDATTSWLVWDNGTVERAKPVLNSGLAGHFTLPILEWDSSLYADLLLDGNGPSNEDYLSNIRVRTGMEISPKPSIRIRGGISETGLLAGGLGISRENWTIDYAMQSPPTQTDLGATHIVSLVFSPRWVFGMMGVTY